MLSEVNVGGSLDSGSEVSTGGPVGPALANVGLSEPTARPRLQTEVMEVDSVSTAPGPSTTFLDDPAATTASAPDPATASAPNPVTASAPDLATASASDLAAASDDPVAASDGPAIVAAPRNMATTTHNSNATTSQVTCVWVGYEFEGDWGREFSVSSLERDKR